MDNNRTTLRRLLAVILGCLKKNQNAFRPSEHPPARGGEISKRLGGMKGCKYKCYCTCGLFPHSPPLNCAVRGYLSIVVQHFDRVGIGAGAPGKCDLVANIKFAELEAPVVRGTYYEQGPVYQ